jgi:diaminohydroxyphosphoribosylaminopyrimidine deaminase / 5-amino-6-(5-phosphoribosylamino)uracil reductase
MHRSYMRRALALAERGLGRTAPNPAVGAVVVSDGRIIAEGWHQAAGGPHAEAVALQQAGDAARAADLYVTLEPCCHQGRTPPCTKAILAAGIRRVFYACSDSDPRVAGHGHRALAQGGCEVFRGPMSQAARDLNRAYFKHKATGLPHLTLKMATTLDGRAATSAGQSQWITGPEARRHVHLMRSQAQLLMIGVGTVLADDPGLTSRLEGDGHHCDALIVDTAAQTPPQARALQRPDGTACFIACSEAADPGRIAALQQAGAQVITLPEQDRRVNLAELMRTLGSRDTMSILCEGGPTLAAALLSQALADEMVFFIAPKLLGDGIGAVADLGVRDLDTALTLEIVDMQQFGPDLMLRGRTCLPD